MTQANRIYELLLDYAADNARITELTVGLVWTACKAQRDGDSVLGLAMSPGLPTRTLAWPGTLAGKTLAELVGWITDWEPYKATVGMAAINCSLNARELPVGLTLQPAPGLGNLAVFEHFLPQLQGKKVVVIGRYPGIERYAEQIDLHIIERQAMHGDYPDPACEFLLPDADWVFITASSLINKTFPRLAELARDAVTVLMGPTVPWLPEFHDFGIDYLAGIEVTNSDSLYRTAAEGGGVRIFENGAHYRIVELNPVNSMAWLKAQIAQCYAEKEQLTQAMEAWYGASRPGRYPAFTRLSQITTRLSRMDSSYKNLWDIHHSQPS